MDTEAAGTTVYLRRLVEELSSQSIESKIFATASPDNATANDRNAKLNLSRSKTDFARFPILGRLLISREYNIDLSSQLRDYSVLHNHGLWLMPNVNAPKIAHKNGVPTIVSPHGMLGNGALKFSRQRKRLFWAALQSKAFAHTKCWHATSEKELSDIRSFGIDQPIALVPIGVDGASRKLPEYPLLRNSQREVLFLGRLHPKKGIDLLLSVWKELQHHHTEWTLNFVGPLNDSYSIAYKTQVAREKIPRVKFSGPAYDAAKERVLREADLFVLPTYDENFGITVGEALAAGTPVVCSDGAPWEGLNVHRCGWWIKQSREDLLNALNVALGTSPEELKKMGQRGTDWVEQAFAWSVVSGKMRDLYSWVSGAGEKPGFVEEHFG